jgi:DNA-binding transcriptional LysR family regulator
MNIQNVDLNLLAVLDALLTERNVTRAASRVHLSQPAASNALARLRHLFKDPLLVRGTGGLVVTPRAQSLIAPVRAAMVQIEAALGAGAPFDAATTTETFTVAMSDALQIALLPALVDRLAQEAPNANLSCLPPPPTRGRNVAGDAVPDRELASGEVDVAFGYFVALPPRLHARALFDGDYVCVVRKSHPLRARGLTLRQYAGLGHLVVSPADREIGTVNNALAQHNLTRRVVVVVPEYNVVPYVIMRSDLVATLPRKLAEGYARIFPLRLLKSPVELPGFTISQLWHERTHHSPAHRWFRGVVAALKVSA